MEKIRKPAAAGQFYEANKISLSDKIKDCFLDDRGPGRLPKIVKGDKKVRGLIVPHAGYIYSGAIAAHSYYFLASNGFADTFVILGPNHTGMGSGVSVMTEGAWQTPLGAVTINISLGKKLFKGIIDNDEKAHYYEHSIEVQLPFLQFCSSDKKFDFVPICMAMQDYETSDEVGKIIAEAVKGSDKNVVIIASTDFSHAGFNYMNMPSEGLRVDQYAEKQDKKAIKQILGLNPSGLIDTVHINDITMCGYGPVAAMLTAAKALGANKAELLKYGSSYEVHPGTSCVGYSAFAIY